MRGAVAVLMVALLASCSSGGGESRRETPSADLTPIADSALDDADEAELGEWIELGDGGYLKLDEPRVGGDDEPFIEVDARGEARGDDAVTMPEVVVLCAGATEGDGWVVSSTFPMYQEVPSKAFAEGHLDLLPLGNERTGVPIEPCATPAVFRVTRDGAPDVVVPIPATVMDAYAEAIDAYNAELDG